MSTRVLREKIHMRAIFKENTPNYMSLEMLIKLPLRMLEIAFQSEHAPGPPLHTPACGGQLPETPCVKPRSAPAVFQYSLSVKWTADIEFFKGTNTKLEDAVKTRV